MSELVHGEEKEEEMTCKVKPKKPWFVTWSKDTIPRIEGTKASGRWRTNSLKQSREIATRELRKTGYKGRIHGKAFKTKREAEKFVNQLIKKHMR